MVTLEALAERQDGVVSVAQARRCGLSPGQISRRRSSGRYRSSRRGVVQIAGVPPTWRQSIRIASIAAGRTVVVSHGSAARLYGVEVPRAVHPRWRHDSTFIELCGPLPRHVRLRGVRGHRSATLDDRDIIRRHGMAVTSPLRTIIDLSSRLGVEGTGRLLDEMLRRGLVKLQEFRERVVQLRPAPGRSVRVLRRVAAARPDGFDAGESNLESRIRRVIARAGFPSPTSQHVVKDGNFKVRLDFAYPHVKVYVEGDGFGFHRYASDLDRDARKRNGLTVRGWIGMDVTWRMTDDEIEGYFARFYDRATGSWTLPR